MLSRQPYYSGDIATPDIKAWRFVFDEGNYWLLTAIQGALGTLAFAGNWIAEGDATVAAAAELGAIPINSLEPTMDLIGLIFPFAGDISHVPDGALLCDGAAYLRTNFPDLFDVIGTTYGATDSTHFNVPDLRGRTVVGVGTGSGLSTYTLAQEVGEETHLLVTSEIPSHSHTDVGHSHGESAAGPNLTTIGPGAPEATAIPIPGVTGLGYANIQATGGNGTHENRQPSIALNYIISAVH